jgi:hypothetical protein
MSTAYYVRVDQDPHSQLATHSQRLLAATLARARGFIVVDRDEAAVDAADEHRAGTVARSTSRERRR